MKLLALLTLIPTFIIVSAIHYAGFLSAEWLHLYVFEPAEIALAAAIGRCWA